MTLRRSMRRFARPWRRSELAQALAEFSLIAPILFLVIFGIVDAARMMQSYVTIQAAAREGARYAVTGRSDCDLLTPGRHDCIVHTTMETAGNLDQDEISVKIRSWPFQAGGYGATPVDDDPGIQCDNVEVAVSYDYHMITPIMDFFVDDFTMRASERLVNEPFGACGVAQP